MSTTYDIKQYVELSVKATAQAPLSIVEKRNMIYSLFSLAQCSNCGFINRGVVPEMIECQYTFAFPKETMFDYAIRPEYYDRLAENEDLVNGDVYAIADAPDMVLVDSGSDAWHTMVSSGKIQGEGARPICVLTPLATLIKAKQLMGKFPNMPVARAHFKLLQLTNSIEDINLDDDLMEAHMTKADLEAMLAE